MITNAQWEGGIDGILILEKENEEIRIDRPGDLVSRMMQEECHPELQAAALIYGYSLATQGVLLPHLVRQVLRKTSPFLRSVSMDSMSLYRAIEHFDRFYAECSEEGDELRKAILAESTRYHEDLNLS
ncbi:MAG: hypothetical protein AAEJ04_03815 [Planctomycetota bacterium]